jgi:hypothetical protein
MPKRCLMSFSMPSLPRRSVVYTASLTLLRPTVTGTPNISSDGVRRPPLCTHSAARGTGFAEFPMMCHSPCTSAPIVTRTLLADGGGGWTFDPTGSKKAVDP